MAGNYGKPGKRSGSGKTGTRRHSPVTLLNAGDAIQFDAFLRLLAEDHELQQRFWDFMHSSLDRAPRKEAEEVTVDDMKSRAMKVLEAEEPDDDTGTPLAGPGSSDSPLEERMAQGYRLGEVYADPHESLMDDVRRLGGSC